ncbi:MAG: hypothetical protein LBV29_04030 [Azoarcus sp.]|jgi:hypothetical protein|nr:hypothetical protein [Azoarcus sp.]
MAVLNALGQQELANAGNAGGDGAGGVDPNDSSTWPVDGAGVPINPAAEGLKDAHAAANGDKTKPGYGGNCTPNEYDHYDAKKEEWCGEASALGRCPGLNSGIYMSYFDRMKRATSYARCADARRNLMDNCFKGGDAGHRQAAIQADLASVNCLKGI